jgi:hypothetical protein
MNSSTYEVYNDVITELQDYMLTDNLVRRSMIYKKNDFSSFPSTSTCLINNKKEKPSTVEKKKETIFNPKQKDSLFWCFYVMVNGDVSYEMLQPINMIVEKKIKIEYIEKIRQNKILLKQHKYATLVHIENQLLNEPRIDIKTFFSLCVLENINVFYIHKKTYYELLMNDDMNTIFILQQSPQNIKHLQNQNQKYGFESETQKTIEQYKKELFHIEHLEKPVKAISAYKLSELIDFCNRLGLETVNSDTKKPKKKQELYEALIQYF